MPKPVLINPSVQRQIHRAGWVVADAHTVIKNGCVEIENGIIKDARNSRPGEESIDHGPGILMPPLVNAHLHIELSALKNAVPFDKGFRFWVKALLEKREALGEKKLIKEAVKAMDELYASGTLYVGDISTLNLTGPLFKESSLKGICFNEYLGNTAQNLFVRKDNDISFSLAGHAPHTTSPELLAALKKKTNEAGLPFSIHLAESEDESKFIWEAKGPWAEFLISRGINYSSWGAGGKSPVEYIHDMGLLGSLTIAVHLLDVDQADLKKLVDLKTKVCICPRSNLNLHHKLPDIELMIESGITPALGTDSLASCGSLSIFDEMAFVKQNYPGLSCKTIFSMGTINGAKALGLERETGTLSKGKKANFLYLPAAANNSNEVFRKIVTNE